MSLTPFNICPEEHIDSGRIELVINAARRRLGFGMDEADVHADLVARGVTADDAHLAIVAAKVLMGDR